jgi:hypothetical protein
VAGAGGSSGTGGSGGSGGTPPDIGGAGGSAGTAGRSGAGGSQSGGSGSGNAGNGSVPNDAGVTGNLFPDPGFELGHVGWGPFGTTTIVDVAGEGRNGTKCVEATDRVQAYAGPSRSIKPPFTEPGQTYRVEGWVRAGVGTPTISMTVKTLCDGETEIYTVVNNVAASATEYKELSGNFSVPTCTLTEYVVYFEGPVAGESFYVDDVGLYLVQ